MKRKFLCTKSLFMCEDEGGEKCFTEDLVYEGIILDESGDRLIMIELIDDSSKPHTVSDDWILHFELID